jgi:hypothetical protein
MRKNRDEGKKINYLDRQNQHRNYKRIGRHEKNTDLLQALHPTLGSQKLHASMIINFIMNYQMFSYLNLV